MESKRLTVTLLGRDHTIRCKAGEVGTLLDIAKELDTQLTKVKERYDGFDNESVVMLHLLNLARKNNKLTQANHEAKRLIERIIKQINAAFDEHKYQ